LPSALRSQAEDDPDHCRQLGSQTRKQLAEAPTATGQEVPRAAVRVVLSPIVAVKVAADLVRAEKEAEADVVIVASEVSVPSVLSVVDVPRRHKRSWTPRWRIILAERSRVTRQQLLMGLPEVDSSLLGTIST